MMKNKVWKIHRCQYCNITASCDSHHIIPRSEGGDNRKSNLCYLCPSHHRACHTGELSILGWKMTSMGRVLMFKDNIKGVD